MKQIGTKISLIVAVTATLVFIMNGYFNISHLYENAKENEKVYVADKISDYQELIEASKEKALWVASIYSNLSIAKQAYQNYQKTNNLQASSLIIEKEVTAINQTIKMNLNLESQPKVHFHLPPAISFIRCWTTTRGDDISKFRASVLTISQNHQPITAIEIGRGGFELRALAPIFDPSNNYLGSVETLYALENILPKISTKKNENFSVYMDTSYLKIATELLNQSATNVKAQNQRIGKLIYVASSNGTIRTHALEANYLNSALTDTVQLQNDSLGYVSFPIKDFARNSVGVLVFQYDRSKNVESLKASTFFNVAFSVGMLLVFIGISFLFTHIIITSPLLKNLKRLKKVEEGNLLPEKTSKRKDELGKLSRFTENMKARLIQIINEIRATSNTIANNSKDFEAISEEMVSNSNQLAASSEELAASIQEMVASINQNKENALNTEQVVLKTSEIISSGFTTMQKTLSSFNLITEKVIIIQEIALKIDILSINAALEAKKAGEYGKGFSVVAQEIRRLSDFSSKSSKEISAITSENIELTNKSSKIMENILPSIQEIVKQIQEISFASVEQNSAAEQINSAIDQFIVVSQSNAKYSDLIKELAHYLQHYSGNLSNSIAQFVTDDKDYSDFSEKLFSDIQKAIDKYNDFRDKKDKKIDIEPPQKPLYEKINSPINLNLNEASDKDFDNNWNEK